MVTLTHVTTGMINKDVAAVLYYIHHNLILYLILRIKLALYCYYMNFVRPFLPLYSPLKDNSNPLCSHEFPPPPAQSREN